MKTATDDALALLESHGKQLFALLFRLTLRHDVADDLLQDLFCKLAASDGFSRAENRLAYSHRMATNLAFDWRRKAKRFSATDGRSTEPVASGQSPLDDLIRREQLDQTLNAISELPQTAREIVVLRYLECETYESIAARLDKTTHQVRAIAFKAIKRLRNELRGIDDLEKVRAESTLPSSRPNNAEGVKK